MSEGEEYQGDQEPKMCATCGEQILGPGIQARGKEFHREHFQCNVCKQPIRGAFKIKDEDQLCNECYDKHHAKYCKGCNDKIVGRGIRAMDTDWHSECFKCQTCNTQIQGNFHRQEGHDLPMCAICFTEKTAIKCTACEGVVVGECVSVQGSKYHAHCFKCSKCSQPIGDAFKLDTDNNIICNPCAVKIVQGP